MSTSRISYLLQQYINDAATPGEQEELQAVLQDSANAPVVSRLLEELIDASGEAPALNNDRVLEMARNVLNSDKVPITGKVVRMGSYWKRWVAAAAIIIGILGVGDYFLLQKHILHTGVTAKIQDVRAPAVNKATITLSNGQKIAVDSIQNGSVTQGNVKLVASATDAVTYQASGTAGEAVSYNTLTVPRGSKVVTLTLSDGTQVWLNNESSLTYPTAFTGKDRTVQITGEGYFEVAHNAAKPFFVQHGDATVQVLGTHFNVNSYEDNNALTVTLLEGSILLRAAGTNKSVTIKPGEQAILSETKGDLSLNQHPEIDEVMAWKNGKFAFRNASIETIMLQVARWYDVQVVYQGTVTERFGGTIPRNVNASEVLNMLALTGKVDFKMEGDKVVVSPK